MELGEKTVAKNAEKKLLKDQNSTTITTTTCLHCTINEKSQ